jgi:AraC-like DNA-binding protein
MSKTDPQPAYVAVLPSVHLRTLISHYWLSKNNLDLTHLALPDASIDIVARVASPGTLLQVFGTTTKPTDIVLQPNCSYLGIKFQPGQSRHFIDASARELTDRCEAAQGLLKFSLDPVLAEIQGNEVFDQLNCVLERFLIANQPKRTRIDQAISQIVLQRGNSSLDHAAAALGRSRRQFERVFLETVGVTPKFFAKTTRFKYAAACITHSSMTLADIAANSGYADQSHMSHEFKRFSNTSPARFAEQNVAYLQDFSLLATQE